MEIKTIKHKLLIDQMWETYILSDNTARVFVQKMIIYDKERWEKEKIKAPLMDIQKAQVDAIFNKDWSTYNGD